MSGFRVQALARRVWKPMAAPRVTALGFWGAALGFWGTALGVQIEAPEAITNIIDPMVTWRTLQLKSLKARNIPTRNEPLFAR